jgi:hypothetical protein
MRCDVRRRDPDQEPEDDGPTESERLTRVRDYIENGLDNIRWAMHARWTLKQLAGDVTETLAELLARWGKVPSCLGNERAKIEADAAKEGCSARELARRRGLLDLFDMPALPDGGVAVAAAIEREWEQRGGAASRGHPRLDEQKAHEFLRVALNVFNSHFDAFIPGEISRRMKLAETSYEKIKRLEACGYTHFVWWLCVHEKMKLEVLPRIAESLKEPDPDNPGERTRDMSAIADALATMDDDGLPGSELIAPLGLRDRWRDGPLEVSNKALLETFRRLHGALLAAGLVSETMTDKAFFMAIGEIVEMVVADTPLGYSMEPLERPRTGTEYKGGRNRVRRGLGLRSDDEIEAVIAAVSAKEAPPKPKN